MRIALASDHAGFSLKQEIEADRGIFVDAWMTTEYLGDVGKDRRRVDKVREISERHLRPLPGGWPA
jgi:ribose 5-phosphate isomerase RpiB